MIGLGEAVQGVLVYATVGNFLSFVGEYFYLLFIPFLLWRLPSILSSLSVMSRVEKGGVSGFSKGVIYLSVSIMILVSFVIFIYAYAMNILSKVS